MNYSHEVECMCPVTKGPHHGPAPIPEEGRWVKAYQISDISGLSHGIGWCAPQQGACKLTLNVKNGIIEEALVETIGCSGMTHSAAMAGEILPGKTLLEVRYLELAEGYITKVALDKNGEAIGYQFVRLGKMMEDIRHGVNAEEALKKNTGTYGRFADAPKYIDPREE